MTTDGPYPNSDESFERLHRSGWSIGDTAFRVAASLVWVVTGSNGENRIRAEGASRDEAWHRACQEARAVGMLPRGGLADPPSLRARF
jgi:hypothetical protein